jgi:hypothetical protein
MHSEFSSCFYSSLVFLVNTGVAYLINEIVYGILFFLLTITSLFFHSMPNIYTSVLDKVVLYSVITYGGFTFFKKLLHKDTTIFNLVYSAIIVSSFLAVYYIYHIGYMIQDLGFHPNRDVANRWHSAIHFISSLGHCLIMVY